MCPHGDSNSSLSLERASSWASRRWGRETSTSPDSCQRCGIWRREAAYAEAGGIVSFRNLIVNDEHVQLRWPMHTDGQRHLDICRA